METLEFVNSSGLKLTEIVYSIHDFPTDGKYPICVKRGRDASVYYNIATAFDIETTTIQKVPLKNSFGFMYHWQYCLHDKVVFGRTWDEFIELLKKLRRDLNLSSKRRLVIFVHNLAFEWQFMNQFIKDRFDDNIDAFYTAKRKPLCVRLLNSGIEFRCSWKLSNMSLLKFTENAGSKYSKLSGEEYDYKKIRTPSTEMQMFEKAYCYCDVRGLCDAVEKEFDRGFNITTLPLTSTGFVRKDTLNAFRNYDRYVTEGKCIPKWQKIFDDMPHKPNNKISSYHYEMSLINHEASLYKAEKNAARGGDTHANIMTMGDILTGVFSHDRKSSYPAVQLTYQYPTGHWKERKMSDDRVIARCEDGKTAVIFTIALKNIRLKKGMRCPYIMEYKCVSVKNAHTDNGRIFMADGLIITITEVDWKIIEKQYEFDIVCTSDIYTCGKDYLPVPLRAVNLMYFFNKCELEDIDPYLYVKSKNLLNGIFGMTFTDVVHDLITYNLNTLKWSRTKADVQEALNKYYASYSSCLHYDTGIYTTAYARKELHEAIFACKDSYHYSDTDSVKWSSDNLEEIKRILNWFDTKNKELRDRAYDCGAFYRKGDREYVLGVWENESKDSGPLYEEFRTFGAKKYAYKLTPANVKKDDNPFHITVAGLNKKKGAKFFKSVSNFKINTIVPKEYSGRLASVVHDEPIHTINIDGEDIETASSWAMVESTYFLGQTFDYMELAFDRELLFL